MDKFDTLVNQLLSEMRDYTVLIDKYAEEVVDVYLDMRETGEVHYVWPGDPDDIDEALTRWANVRRDLGGDWDIPTEILAQVKDRVGELINQHN